MPYPQLERPLISPSSPEILSENRELLERFQATQTKFAIQKDGALTDVARTILRDTYDVFVPPTPKGRVSVSVSEDGETGFIYARNKSICNLVAEGAADMAIVGTDRLIEDEAEDRVDIVSSYKDQFAWSLVLATPTCRGITQLEEVNRVATQYPIITSRYFASLGREDVTVTTTTGGTELYPYLQYGDQPIDAIVDLTATGESLAAHDMAPWTPAIGEVYPVLIQKRQEATEADA